MSYIKNGTVLFPRAGCEALLAEILGFGFESHDDLLDGLITLIEGRVERRFTGLKPNASDIAPTLRELPQCLRGTQSAF
jgi:hypothetical protein